MTPGPSPLSVRQLNRLRVIETIYRYPATSRAELTRHTGLARQTVSTVIDELLSAGVVEEHGAPEDDRPRNSGRPPILLSLVSDAAFAVGLDFGHQHIRVAVCDLRPGSACLAKHDRSSLRASHFIAKSTPRT